MKPINAWRHGATPWWKQRAVQQAVVPLPPVTPPPPSAGRAADRMAQLRERVRRKESGEATEPLAEANRMRSVFPCRALPNRILFCREAASSQAAGTVGTAMLQQSETPQLALSGRMSSPQT